jgi:hypothetical protein
VTATPGTHTFTDGIATSSEANSFVRDPINFLLAPPIALLRQTVLQSLTTAVMTAITFDVEDLDTNVAGTSQHDNVTNNSRFTAVYAGWYQVSGGVGVASSTAGRRACRWAVNGTFLNGSAVYLPANPSGTCEVPSRTHLLYLNVGDYVELQGYQDSGGSLNTATTTDTMSTMAVRWSSN